MVNKRKREDQTNNEKIKKIKDEPNENNSTEQSESNIENDEPLSRMYYN